MFFLSFQTVGRSRRRRRVRGSPWHQKFLMVLFVATKMFEGKDKMVLRGCRIAGVSIVCWSTIIMSEPRYQYGDYYLVPTLTSLGRLCHRLKLA